MEKQWLFKTFSQKCLHFYKIWLIRSHVWNLWWTTLDQVPFCIFYLKFSKDNKSVNKRKRMGCLTYHWEEIAFKYFRRTKSFKSFSVIKTDSQRIWNSQLPTFQCFLCLHINMYACVCACVIFFEDYTIWTSHYLRFSLSPWVWLAEICESLSIISLLWCRRETQFYAWEQCNVSCCLLGSIENENKEVVSLYSLGWLRPHNCTRGRPTPCSAVTCVKDHIHFDILAGTHTLQHFEEAWQTEPNKVVQFFPGHG